MHPAALTLSRDELAALTGYLQPSAQLAELRRQGFNRARRDRLGRVILEREHYLAVCGGSCEPRGLRCVCRRLGGWHDYR